MFNKNIKLFFVAVSFSYAILQFIQGNIGNGIMLILISGMFLLLYFKNEMILLAMLKMKKQDMEGTKRLLLKIKKPESCLVKKQQGYYNYLFGLISSQKNLTEAERYLRKALKIGLNMSFDEAMAKLTLSGIMMQKRRKQEATTLLNQAKKMDKHSMLTDQIKMMQQQLKKI